MSKLIETLTRSSGFGRYLPTLLALGFGLSGGGLWLLENLSLGNGGGGLSVFHRILSAILWVVIILLCVLCVWLIEKLLRHLRLANRELKSYGDSYPTPLPIERYSEKAEPDATATMDASTYYTLTIQDLYNNAPCGYHSIDTNGRVVLMNDTELKMWGFFGTAVLLCLFLALLIRLLIIAERQRDLFTRYYAYCVAGILFFHLFINVGMTIGAVPVVGIPLPFVSYGGSSLISFCVQLSILFKLDSQRSF